MTGGSDNQTLDSTPFNAPVPAFLGQVSPRSTSHGWRGRGDTTGLVKVTDGTAFERFAVIFSGAGGYLHYTARRLENLLLFRKSLRLKAHRRPSVEPSPWR